MGELSLRRVGGAAKFAVGTFTPSSTTHSFQVSGLKFVPDHVNVIKQPGGTYTGLWAGQNDPSFIVGKDSSVVSSAVQLYLSVANGVATINENGTYTDAQFTAGNTYRYVLWKE